MGNFHSYVSLPEGICPYVYIYIYLLIYLIHMNTLPETNGLPLKNLGLEDEFPFGGFGAYFQGASR